MKTLLFSLISLCFVTAAHAQWQRTTYTLKGGWNSIYLHGDATHATPAELFELHKDVLEVWRWNPNPNPVGFTSTPLFPSSGTPEWSTWKRGEEVPSLTGLSGPSAYLVKCKGGTADTYAVSIAHQPRPPSTTWVRNGGNLLGFPSRNNSAGYPTMSSYFATFPAAVAANTRIFKYVGGELGAGNPRQVFSAASEPLDRNQAYWFSSEVVGNFYAPAQMSLSSANGFDFGRRGSEVTVRVLNRTSDTMELTVAPVPSSSAPSGQEEITGSVPITRLNFNEQGEWKATALVAEFTVPIEPNASTELRFGIDRSKMTDAMPDALYASLLRFTDSTKRFDIIYPASARKPSMAGLWIGEASVTKVESKAQEGALTPTGSSFPLRYLLHISDEGTPRILSQVFLGPLASAPHPLGLCNNEDGLNPSTLASAMRIVSTHMPLDSVLTASGSVTASGELSFQIECPYNDPTNPFVHQYHPDHDNKSGTTELLNGRESYTVIRDVTFTFTASPPGAGAATGWGSSVGGTYAEEVAGLHRESLKLSGTFQLQRASEIGSLQIVN